MTQQQFDPSSAEAFADRLVATLNGGAVALMTSIGHRSGLFDVLAETGSVTSQDLAQASRLHERYVREWLGAMTAAGIVVMDGDDRYLLPPEHAASLTRRAGSDNLAVLSQYIGLLGGVEDRILGCFREGGGVPYSEFGRFQEVMSEDSGMSTLPALIDTILPLIPGGTAAFEAGIELLDVGCGAGRALILMAAAYPRSRFTGYDISAEGIARAQADAESRGLDNVAFEVRDVARFDVTGRYDVITAFDAIHDQAMPRLVLANIARALKPGGTFLMQDIGACSHHGDNLDHPIGPLLYTISCMHCMTVSLAAGGEGLGAMWGEEKARELLADAGFGRVTVHHLEHDIQNYYYVCQLGSSDGAQNDGRSRGRGPLPGPTDSGGWPHADGAGAVTAVSSRPRTRGTQAHSSGST
jgi:SAM-dependent methyltransferase